MMMTFFSTSSRVFVKMVCISNVAKAQISNLATNLKQVPAGASRLSHNCDIRSVRSARPISRFSLTTTSPNDDFDKQILRLAEVDELYIVQKEVENVGSLLEGMSQYGYDIKDGKGEVLYTASHIHGPHDPFFELKIYGSDGQPILKKRLYQTVPAGMLHMQVHSMKGKSPLVGIVQERNVDNGGKKFFELRTPDNEITCIVSSHITGRMMSRHHKILSSDGHREVGKIFKRWNALFSGDNLKIAIDVPRHLKPSEKALLIGVPILLGQRYTK